MKQGVLLVSLGTPNSCSVKDVRKYLTEFLMDARVLDINTILRFILVKGIIAPFRSRKSRILYRKIWSSQTGSPLRHYSLVQQYLLQEALGPAYQVELAMRYQNPSIAHALEKLKKANVESIQVVPLFPQYASATTGSVFETVMKQLEQWPTIPNLSFVNSFHDNEWLIEAFAQNGAEHQPESYDHILFSFHGLPQRQLINSDHNQQHCGKKEGCCKTYNSDNKYCYAAQCYHTAALIAQRLDIPSERYSVCFQSRLENDPWVQPYTAATISDLAKAGKKRLLVFCPAFVADCLETLYEIAIEYDELFKAAGGEHLQLVESLNASPLFINALKEIATGEKMPVLEDLFA
jgi:ferrochelatase